MEAGYESKVNYTKEMATYEICVCCRKQTGISAEQDIELRPFYIEGAGQLCYDCYQELYGKC